MITHIDLGVKSIAALKMADVKNLNGKILIDVANPLDFSKGLPPILLPELSNTNSLGEEIVFFVVTIRQKMKRRIFN